YDRLTAKAPEKWEREFHVSSLFLEFVEKRLAASPDEPQPPSRPSACAAPPVPADDNRTQMRLPGVNATVDAGRLPLESLQAPAEELAAKERQRRRRTSPVHQFLVLTLRYAELVWRDQRSFRLLLLQAPLVAVFVLLGFLGRPYQSTLMIPRE